MSYTECHNETGIAEIMSIIRPKMRHFLCLSEIKYRALNRLQESCALTQNQNLRPGNTPPTCLWVYCVIMLV